MKENIFVSKLYDVIIASDDKVSLKDAQGIFIVMEYVPNDMKKLLLEVEPNSLKEKHALIIIYNLLCAANYIHSANIMHRDIKPANLLINHSCQISLCDFGQARCVPHDKPLLSDTGKISSNEFASEIDTADSNRAEQLNSFSKGAEILKAKNKQLKPRKKLSNHVSSRWYRPPEVILTQRHYDTKMDIWGIGCVIAEILLLLEIEATGKPDRELNIEDMFMFPGSSCFPLTPDTSNVK